jgi:hypothetical protein
MRPPARLAAFGAVLAVVLAAGAAIGALAGPLDGDDDEPAPHAVMAMPDTAAPSGGEHPAGLRASQDGYVFAPAATTFPAAGSAPFSFRILGPDGSAVTRLETRHDKDLHLVVVSDDLGDYQHVHPTLAAEGTWSTGLDLRRPGSYRAYADFAAAGAEPLTLSAELTATGVARPEPLPAPTTDARVDGYEVGLTGGVAAGADGELSFEVSRDGRRVTDLEPYLGAYGHLVAIRASDHAYLHVHPTEGSSPERVAFGVHVPSVGAYRLFLDFRHDGAVHSAAFTLDVAGDRSGAGATGHTEEDDHGQ